MRKRPESLWLGLVLTGAIFEAWAIRGKRKQHTLSHAMRRTCHTETALGKRVFVLAWAFLTAWLIPHILEDQELL